MPNDPVPFEAPAPCCGDLCWWTATPNGSTPHCPCASVSPDASMAPPMVGDVGRDGTGLGDAA